MEADSGEGGREQVIFPLRAMNKREAYVETGSSHMSVRGRWGSWRLCIDLAGTFVCGILGWSAISVEIDAANGCWFLKWHGSTQPNTRKVVKITIDAIDAPGQGLVELFLLLFAHRRCNPNCCDNSWNNIHSTDTPPSCRSSTALRSPHHKRTTLKSVQHNKVKGELAR